MTRSSRISRSPLNIAFTSTAAIRRPGKWPRFMPGMRITKLKANNFGDSMKRFLMVLLLVLFCIPMLRAADAKDDLPSIFNGKDLTGWKAAADNKWWKVIDGVLVGENDEGKKGN